MKIFVEDKNLKGFKRHYNWFMELVDYMPEMKASMLVINTKFLMAQMHFEFEEYKKAQSLIEGLKVVFKTKELFLQVLECDLYLLAVNLSLVKDTKMADFSSAYDKVMDTAKVLGISLHGRSIGKLEWIIGGQLFAKSADFKKKALDVHFRKAYKELSPSKKMWELVSFL